MASEDFVALRIKFNDPAVSFFTMVKGVPHGEATTAGDGKPASFYVTEPRDVVIRRVDFGEYQLKI